MTGNGRPCAGHFVFGIGYAAFTQPFIASTRATKSDIALSVASGASRCGEWRAPGSSATSTGQ